MKFLFLYILCCALLTGCNAQGAAQATTPPPSTAAATESVTTLTLYLPNADATGYDQQQAAVSALDETAIVNALIEEGVLAADVEVLSFRQEGEALYLDLNHAFGTQLRSTGTAGETMLLGSLVNTFLTAYQASTITITENGQILESGHAIYDAPLELFQ